MQVFDRDVLPDASGKALSFTYDQNYFKFEYLGIRLAAPQKVRYRYRLSGIDANWVETTNRFVQYTNLDDGHYTFEVKAANEWGYWSEPARFRFRIRPAWWETWWFRLLMVALAGFIAWMIYRIRVGHLLAMERTRIRIAQDLHDDIGSDLTHIFLQTESIEKCRDLGKIHRISREICRNIQEVIQALSDAVWAIDARNDTIGDMVDRMQDLAYQLLLPLNIKFDFHVAGLDKSRAMNGILRHQVFMIYKEAVHNIARHSQATAVKIQLMQDQRQFSMKITDNGQGIQEGKEPIGNGLQNMKARAGKINAKLTISSNGGVTIDLRRSVL
ncbi:MAG: hypothetical protein Kow0042_23310 [Calditrichia bacterium]